MIRGLVGTVVIVAAALAAAPTANADLSYDQLRGMLPSGVNPDSCHPDEPRSDVIGLECPDDIPGGPTGGQYQLYANLQVLGANFDHAVTSFQKVPCPIEGADGRASRWSAGGEGQGLIFCAATPQGKSQITWSKEATLFVGNIQSPDLQSLWKWWLDVGQYAG